MIQKNNFFFKFMLQNLIQNHKIIVPAQKRYSKLRVFHVLPQKKCNEFSTTAQTMINEMKSAWKNENKKMNVYCHGKFGGKI